MATLREKNQLPNLRMFKVKYLGATNTRGSRVKITDCRFNKSVTIDYDHMYNSASDQAAAYIESFDIYLTGATSSDGVTTDILLTDNFGLQIAVKNGLCKKCGVNKAVASTNSNPFDLTSDLINVCDECLK